MTTTVESLKGTENGALLKKVLTNQKGNKRKRYTVSEDLIILRMMNQKLPDDVMYRKLGVELRDRDYRSLYQRVVFLKKNNVTLALDPSGPNGPVNYPSKKTRKLIQNLKTEKQSIDLREGFLNIMFEKDTEQTIEAIAKVVNTMSKMTKSALISKILKENKDIALESFKSMI